VKHKTFTKGQVSVETLLAIIIVFVFLMVVFLQNYTVSYANETLSSTYIKKGECLKLAFVISKAYTEGDGTSINYTLSESADVIPSEKSVKIGQDFCRYLAISNQYSLSPSVLTITNNKGVISISSS
jgi:hypothetical protein